MHASSAIDSSLELPRLTLTRMKAFALLKSKVLAT